MTATIIKFPLRTIDPLDELYAASRLAELELERAVASVTARCNELERMAEDEIAKIENILARSRSFL